MTSVICVFTALIIQQGLTVLIDECLKFTSLGLTYITSYEKHLLTTSQSTVKKYSTVQNLTNALVPASNIKLEKTRTY